MKLIEQLDELHGKATQGEWDVTDIGSVQGQKSTVYSAGDELRYVAYCHDTTYIKEPTPNEANAALIVALHNAWPQISEVLREVEGLPKKLSDMAAEALAADPRKRSHTKGKATGLRRAAIELAAILARLEGE